MSGNGRAAVWTAANGTISERKDKVSNSSNPSTHSTPAGLTEDISMEVSITEQQPSKSHQHFSINDLRKKYAVDLAATLSPQPVALEVLGHHRTGPIAIYGGLTLITAKAKAGKTFAHSILVAALVKGGDMFGKLRAHYITGKPSKRKIIIFDTEQSEYDSQKVGKRIQAMANTSNNLEVWKLRAEPNDKKRDIIRQAIYEDPDVCAIVIDGGRDTIFDINAPEECSRAASEVLKWAEELGVAIFIILHQNKNDVNARGHYGTELKNKAEIIVNVSKDKETGIFIIETEDSRSIEFEPIAFQINEKGIPELAAGWTPTKKENASSKRATKFPNTIGDEFHKVRIKEAFNIESKPTYAQAWRNIKTVFQTSQKIGDNEAKDFLGYYQLKGWIKKVDSPESEKKWPVYVSTLPV